MTIGEKLDKLYLDKEYYENRIDDLYERLNVIFNEMRRERIYELLDIFEEKLSGIMSEIEELEIEEDQKLRWLLLMAISMLYLCLLQVQKAIFQYLVNCSAFLRVLFQKRNKKVYIQYKWESINKSWKYGHFF